MAHVLTPKDGHVIMNLLVKELTGGDSTIQVVDSSSFVAAGDLVATYPKENVLSSLSMVLGRTITNVKPINSKFGLITLVEDSLYGQISREILVYSKPAQAAGDFNTDLYTNFAPGFDNGKNPTSGGVAQSVGTMWEQNPAVVSEIFVGGSVAWDVSLTVYDYQLNGAFASEEGLITLVNAILTEKYNDIIRERDAFARMTMLNHMAAVYDLDTYMPGSKVNLTAAFNAKYGTTYSTADLLGEYYPEFLAFLVARIKNDSNRMEESSVLYHWTPAKNVGGVDYDLLRNTPKSSQKLALYGPMFVDAESEVMAGIFNDKYLKLENFEQVTFWQNINEPMKIDVTPAIPDAAGTNGGLQTAGANVKLSHVVGMLFDETALAVRMQLESADSTIQEARKKYRNLWWHFAKNSVNNFTRPCILYYMAD